MKEATTLMMGVKVCRSSQRQEQEEWRPSSGFCIFLCFFSSFSLSKMAASPGAQEDASLKSISQEMGAKSEVLVAGMLRGEAS